MKTNDASPLRAVLVDDERLACKRLTTLLAAHPEIKVLGEARDLAAARRLLSEHKPDIVFLDIQLPPDDGFDLLPDVPSETDVIFVTAHDAFAVRAFEANALDYLLKPVLPARLAKSIERLKRTRHSLPQPALDAAPAHRLAPNDPLLLRNGRRWHKVETTAVAAIRGEGTYTRLYTAAGESMLLLRTLTQWTAMLPEDQFVRVSRSVVVNLRQIERLESINRNRADLYVKSHPSPLQLGRVASRHLRSALHKYGAPH